MEKSRREEYAEATRLALLVAGQEKFSKDGYQGTSAESVSKAARVTRGAFYHHFEDKKALFDAVVVSLQSKAAKAVAHRASGKSNSWDMLWEGINSYLDECLDPAYQRLVIQEAPTIIGPARYREIEDEYLGGMLAASLNRLKRHGDIACEETGLLARLLDAMICETAILLIDTKDPSRKREAALVIIRRLLESFRIVRKARA